MFFPSQAWDGEESESGGGEERVPEDAVQQSVSIKQQQQQQKKNSSHQSSRRGVLSFEAELEDDGDGEEFKIKKTARSQRMAKELEREKKRMEEKERRRAEREAKRLNASREESEEEEETREVPLVERLSTGYLPDATMIHAIRKKREMARKLGVDYLPLDGSKR